MMIANIYGSLTTFQMFYVSHVLTRYQTYEVGALRICILPMRKERHGVVLETSEVQNLGSRCPIALFHQPQGSIARIQVRIVSP